MKQLIDFFFTGSGKSDCLTSFKTSFNWWSSWLFTSWLPFSSSFSIPISSRTPIAFFIVMSKSSTSVLLLNAGSVCCTTWANAFASVFDRNGNSFWSTDALTSGWDPACWSPCGNDVSCFKLGSCRPSAPCFIKLVSIRSICWSGICGSFGLVDCAR